MPVTLDQILTSTRDGLPALRAPPRRGRARGGAHAPRPPSFAARAPARAGRGDRRGEAPLSVGRVDPRGSRSGRARRSATRAMAPRPSRCSPTARSSAARWTDLRARPRPASRVPVLRKDFILDELQIVEARAAGAAAVLLIVRALPPARLERAPRLRARTPDSTRWSRCTRRRRWRVRSTPAPRILGVNSRDLDTFRDRHRGGLGDPRGRSRRARRRRGKRDGERGRRRACGGGRRGRGADRHRALLGRRARRRCSSGSAEVPAVADSGTPSGQDLRPHAAGGRGGRGRGRARRTWASSLLAAQARSPPRRPPRCARPRRGVPVFGVFGDQIGRRDPPAQRGRRPRRGAAARRLPP